MPPPPDVQRGRHAVPFRVQPNGGSYVRRSLPHNVEQGPRCYRGNLEAIPEPVERLAGGRRAVYVQLRKLDLLLWGRESSGEF